jgi:hypothetical protein
LFVQRQRQVNQAGDGHHAENHRQAVAEAIEAYRPEFMQCREAAAQREGKQYRRFDADVENSDLATVDRVIGRLLMGREGDALGKIGRHGVAVRRDETDVTPFQPKSDCYGQQEKSEKN